MKESDTSSNPTPPPPPLPSLVVEGKAWDMGSGLGMDERED